MGVDQPARTASTPAIVGREDLSNAITLQMVAQQLAFPLALPLVGVLNDAFDAGTVYCLTLLAWLVILPLIGMLRFRSVGEADRTESMLGNIRSGLAYARADATIFGVIGIVLTLQVLGMPGPATLGPLWMTKVLGLEPSQVGLMVMTWGLGTFVSSFFFLFRKGPSQRGITLCIAVLTFAACSIVFGHSRIIPVTAVANFGLGASMVGTMVTANTIVQQNVSDAMRGRVMGLFPLAMGLSMLGGLPVGLAGDVYGLPVIVPTLGWVTLAATALIVIGRPQLRSVGRHPNLAPAPVSGG
jgi:predicted MFS family arabinose efflux permease